MRNNTILLFCVIFLCQTTIAYSQGGGGRSTTPSNPKPKEIEIPKNKGKPNTPNRTPNKTPAIKKPIVKKPTPSKPNSPKVLYASLSITVNEPESEIFLADRDGNIFEDAESAFTGEGGSPLVFDEVSTGTYTLTVRKYGFFDVERQITVKGGKINPFSITLRPSMPFLSVSTNVDGAKIEIDNIGEFENQIRRIERRTKRRQSRNR